jgi:mRNA-decapping enzyme subunit 2
MEGAHFTKMTETVSQHSIPLEILDDLGSRFIINVPEEERKDLIRICFQIELAHWFYVDEYVKGDKIYFILNVTQFCYIQLISQIK